MMLIGLLVSGFSEPYVDYAQKYVDWRTGVSCGTAVAVLLIVLLIAALASRTNRSDQPQQQRRRST